MWMILENFADWTAHYPNVESLQKSISEELNVKTSGWYISSNNQGLSLVEIHDDNSVSICYFTGENAKKMPGEILQDLNDRLSAIRSVPIVFCGKQS